jgi:transcriptional regulator with XRE-family HTH domain
MNAVTVNGIGRKTDPDAISSTDRTLIAKRIRQLRKLREMSTRELGRRSGMSAGIVSMIENEKSGVSIESLRRIAGALEVPVVQFLSDSSSTAADEASGMGSLDIVRAKDRPRLDLPGSPVSIQMLTHSVNHSVEFVWVEFKPGTELAELIAHIGEEYVLVIQGTMHFHLGDAIHVLHEGDSMVFDSSVPHGVENRGSKKLIQISAITPPSY